MSYAGNPRHVDLVRSENELTNNIRKATSIEETAPKRKHVRACILYTWDHKSSVSFWQGMKVQPILADEVQTFKALICVHKVLQEGHPITLREAQSHLSWLESIARATVGDGLKGYGSLIREYVHFLLTKLRFHRQHTEFNGTFEYEEYISLKSIDDPNEGYETISELMHLQDQIDLLQKLVFAHFRTGTSNECRIASLVPLVQESYGIYKFLTSMLRALHHSTDDEEALDPLRSRYNAQHFRLAKFYYECSNIRYLTSLISIPKLPEEPRDLKRPPDVLPEQPPRPKPAPPPVVQERRPTPPPKEEDVTPFWETNNVPTPVQEVQQTPLYQPAMFPDIAQQMEQQRQAYMEEQARLANERNMLAQQHTMASNQMGQLEQQIAALNFEHQKDLALLNQYDEKVKLLEAELQRTNSVLQSLEAQAGSSQLAEEKAGLWKSKYEALAKLYSQLRAEHLDTLAKFKQAQIKAASAQEALDKVSRLEKELKSKNLELAGLIRERDKAKTDIDRMKLSSGTEVDKTQRQLKSTLQELEDMRSRNSKEIADLRADYNKEIRQLRDRLEQAQGSSESLNQLRNELALNREELRAKEEDLEIFKTAMDEALLELNDLKLSRNAESNMLDGHLQDFMAEQGHKIAELIDAILENGIQRIEDAQYRFDIPGESQRASPSALAILQSHIEKSSHGLGDLTSSYKTYCTVAKSGAEIPLVRALDTLVHSVADIFQNAGFVNSVGKKEKEKENVLSHTRAVGSAAIQLLKGLFSFSVEDLQPSEKLAKLESDTRNVSAHLRRLATSLEDFSRDRLQLNKAGEDLDDVVDNELAKVANSIQNAASKLADLKRRGAEYSFFELKVHESLLASASAVMTAVARLIQAATASQKEIAMSFGAESRTSFYKKNNRWTEGLISAAKAVASATNLLIQVADGVLSGKSELEQLIVACNEVAASTAQLVISSRVKSSLTSSTHSYLESVSKEVTQACRGLVRKVEGLIAGKSQGEERFNELSGHDLKVKEMEQQVEILKLENELSLARVRLGKLRELTYTED